MSVDLRNKLTLATYVDTVLVEAGKNRGLQETKTLNLADPKLRPYTHSIPHFGFAIAATAAFAASNEKKSEEHDKDKNVQKYSRINAFLASIFSTGLTLFSRTQAAAAAQQLKSSESSSSAAHTLRFDWHKSLKDLDNPIARVSNAIEDLTQKVLGIDLMRKTEATNYSNCGLLGIFGGGVLAIGMYAAAQWLKTVGKIVLFITAGFYVFTWLSHREDQKRISGSYLLIGKLCEKIRYALCYYNDQMQLQSKKGSEYTPLFSQFVDDKYIPALPTENELQQITYIEVIKKIG